MGNDFLGNCFEEKFHELWFWEERAIEKSLISVVTKNMEGVEMTLLRRSLTVEREMLPQKRHHRKNPVYHHSQ